LKTEGSTRISECPQFACFDAILRNGVSRIHGGQPTQTSNELISLRETGPVLRVHHMPNAQIRDEVTYGGSSHHTKVRKVLTATNQTMQNSISLVAETSIQKERRKKTNTVLKASTRRQFGSEN
jgi:hypothetical protein